MTMKRAAYVWLSGVIAIGLIAGCAWGRAQQDSLAEYARQKRLEKQSEPAPKKVFDNDNLPRDVHISVVGSTAKEEAAEQNAAETGAPANEAAAAEQPKDSSGSTTQPDASKTPQEVTPGQSAEDRQKVFDDWKKKIADQKSKVDLESRELDVMQREYRLRAVAVYSDAGNRLRNSGTWDKEDKQYKEQIATKQKALDAAKQQLADLQEQARKAGVPSKDREAN
jgi:hypothetical protein